MNRSRGPVAALLSGDAKLNVTAIPLSSASLFCNASITICPTSSGLYSGRGPGRSRFFGPFLPPASLPPSSLPPSDGLSPLLTSPPLPSGFPAGVSSGFSWPATHRGPATQASPTTTPTPTTASPHHPP